MKNFDTKGFKGLFVLGIVLALCSFKVSAQTSDSLYKPEREFKNTIHFNITNPLIFGGKSLIFGYERVLKNNHSFTINIGQAALPTFHFAEDSKLVAKSILGDGGFHISGDYRFYLGKLNKYSAPRGVYIGPYYSYNTFNKKNSWDYTSEGNSTTELVDTDLRISIHTVGFELGYQFVFWKRFSVDMVLIGPGVAGYNLKAKVGGNLTDEERQLFFDKLNEALKDKFPGYNNSVGNDTGEFQRKGTKSTTSFGYRYMIQLGYRF